MPDSNGTRNGTGTWIRWVVNSLLAVLSMAVAALAADRLHLESKIASMQTTIELLSLKASSNKLELDLVALQREVSVQGTVIADVKKVQEDRRPIMERFVQLEKDVAFNRHRIEKLEDLVAAKR